ncbi:hypothetical protein N7508_011008 [Penicillium antarcticum]|uniref:uncharacterized protein n=1 Tax=Penicillium antarcticum TaxID=416450 RepID=UPI0023961DB1|nr:uncharacterized protein N7508_011008 [Penicillium antarcticum]KAJ5296187.1 hypothetical protein N7508_011008 [Penicillium antarcticum]
MTLDYEEPWGLRWRSSPYFIVTALAVALLTDEYLYGFLVPIFPFIVETRLGIDASLTQRISLAMLSESALVSVIASPIIGHYADRSDKKRAWLLSGLAVALLGSLILALANSLFALFAGRLMQALGSACVWVISFATIADQVPADDLGKVYGFVAIAISVGTSGGPLVAGILFDLGGYWTAWSSVLVVIVFDIVFRILILEKSQPEPITVKAGTDAERDALIPPSTSSDNHEHPTVDEKTGLEFYLYLFRNGRFFGGVVSYFCFALLTTSFDTTLPLHVRDTFHWKSLPAGLLFAAFQGPAVFLAVPVGWLKDKVGTRHPTAIGFLLLVPTLWMIGVPGDARFPWANRGDLGQILYSVAVTCAGVVICLLNGVGMMEATQAVEEIQEAHPGIFGPNGGYSRAISAVSVSWTLGMFFGPILAGYATEQIGYYEMNCLLGLSPLSKFFSLCRR